MDGIKRHSLTCSRMTLEMESCMNNGVGRRTGNMAEVAELPARARVVHEHPPAESPTILSEVPCMFLSWEHLGP